MKTVFVLVALSMLVASFVVNPWVAHAASHSPTINRIPVTIDSKVEQDPASVISAFDAALNAHDVTAGLDLFAADGFVHDVARETYSYSAYPLGVAANVVAPACRMFGDQPVCSYNGKDKIGDWLQELVLENVQVQEIGAFQVSSDNVTWNLAVSVDGYRSVGIAPLTETGEATVQGGKIQSLTFSLTAESTNKLEAAFAKAGRSQVIILTGGFITGIVALGLIFPAAALYYISRVKSLFENVPRLERPWLLLQVGVVSLFLAFLLAAVKNFFAIQVNSLDTIQYVVVVLTGAFILAAMVLMKRVWTITPGE
jgi:hypothetical protein